jgi:hypothetical protein
VQSKGVCPLSKVVFIGSPSLLGFKHFVFLYAPCHFYFFSMILDGYFEGTLQASWGKKEEEKGQKSINLYAMQRPKAGAF